MSRADYAHHNEDADWMWWQEEGRHPYEPDEYGDRDGDYPEMEWDDVCDDEDDE